MGLLLAAGLIAWVLTKAITDARIDKTYADQGLVSPRLQAKYGDEQPTNRYGMLSYFADAWSDHWQRRRIALDADRKAYEENPTQPKSLRERWADAKAVMRTGAKKLVEPVGRGTQKPAEPLPEPATPVPSTAADPEVGTVCFTDEGRQRWDGKQWQPAAEPNPAVPAPKSEPVSTTKEQPMTAPTGEATNYETTIAQLEALAAEQRQHVEHCQAALKNVQDATAAIDNMQGSYRESAKAAGTMAEMLAALHLDGITLANAGTTADAMPPNVVDQLFSEMETLEAFLRQRLAEAEAALGATEANLRHVQSTYGDAADVVNGQLGGDSTFLGNGGTRVYDGPVDARGAHFGQQRTGEDAVRNQSGGGVTNTFHGPVDASTANFGQGDSVNVTYADVPDHATN